MKIFFNRPIKKEAWGGGSHFITSLYYYLQKQKIDVTFNLEKDIDLIFMFEPRPDGIHAGLNEILEFKKVKNVPVIQRINDTDIARHGYGLSPHDPPWRIKTLLYANNFVDHTIFISKWVKNHYTEHGYEKRGRSDSVIINGCNSDFFYPRQIHKNVGPLKVITHHWSDNPMKGLDLYIAMDQICSDRKDIQFSYLGRYPKRYTPKNTKLITPKYGIEIGNILRENDLYITGARFEACGMHHIEAAACGLPVIYHSHGGAINEICKDYGKEISCVNSLNKALEYYTDAKNRNDAIGNINLHKLSDKRCNSEYLQVIIDVIDKHKN